MNCGCTSVAPTDTGGTSAQLAGKRSGDSRGLSPSASIVGRLKYGARVRGSWMPWALMIVRGSAHHGRCKNHRHLPQRAGSACIEELLGESLYPEGMPVGLGVLHRLALQLALRQGYAFVAKLSKHPLHVVRTGEPLTQYPEQETDNLLMIYASSVPERDDPAGGMPYPG